MMLQYLAVKVIATIAAVGDFRIALVVAGILWVRLAMQGRWRASLWWAASVIGCAATMLTLKIGFHTGVLSISGVALVNPSGHTAMSTVVYGPIGWLISREMRGWASRAVSISGWLSAAAIGLSLYALGAHTGPDVFVGGAVGGLWASSFVWLGWRHEPAMVGRPILVMLAIAVTVVGLLGAQHITHMSPIDFPVLSPALAARR